MRVLFIIMTIWILSGCNGTGEKSVSHKGNPESARTQKEEIVQHQSKNLTADTSLGENSGDQLKPIREKLRRINNIKTWSSTERRKLNQSTEGGEATYYFHGDTPVKIVATHFGETGKTIREFYPENGQLSFVLEKEYKYNRPITWDSAAMKAFGDTEVFDINKSEINIDSSYFENGSLFRQINNQDCGAPFSKDYLREEQARLFTEFKKLTDRLKRE